MVNKANLNTAAAPGIELMRQDCIITISTTTEPTRPPRHKTRPQISTHLSVTTKGSSNISTESSLNITGELYSESYFKQDDHKPVLIYL